MAYNTSKQAESKREIEVPKVIAYLKVSIDTLEKELATLLPRLQLVCRYEESLATAKDLDKIPKGCEY